jgi:hypothetical protein
MKPYNAVNLTSIFRFVLISMTTYTSEKLRIIGLSYGEIARHSLTSLLKRQINHVQIKATHLCVDGEVLNVRARKVSWITCRYYPCFCQRHKKLAPLLDVRNF